MRHAQSSSSLRSLISVIVATVLVARGAAAQVVGPNVNVGDSHEGSIAISPTDPANLVVSSNFFAFYSLNNGQTWSSSSIGGLSICCDENVAFDSAGNAYLQALAFPPSGGRGVRVAKSIDKGQTYPVALAGFAENHVDAAADQGFMAIDNQPDSPFRDNIYVVWSEYGNHRCQGGSNSGNICSDPSHCPGGSCNAVFPPMGNVMSGFPLFFTRSTNGAATFALPIDITESCNFQEHSSSITTGPNGEIYVVWIGCGAVRFDKSLDGGLTWGSDRVVRTFPAPANSFPLSDDVRGNPTVVVDRTTGIYRGRIYVSSIDTNAPGGAADAWMAYSSDGGDTWSSPVYMSDGPRGAYKYYFQPRLSVGPSGRLDAAWYDTRFNASTDTNNVTYDFVATYSLDGGATFRPNVRVTDVSSVKVTTCPNQGGCGQRVLFEYTGLASDLTRTFPLWTDLRTGTQRQFTAQLSGFTGADLTFSAFSASVNTSRQVAIANTMKNVGTVATSGSFSAAFSLSLDTARDGSDVLLGTRSRGSALAPGNSDSATTKLDVPAGTAPGDYYVVGFVDSGGSQVESNEGNNVAVTAATLNIRPDLLSRSISADRVGTSLQVTDSVGNEGPLATAGTIRLDFYLSLNTSITTGDVFIGSRTIGTSIAANGTNTATSTFAIPQNLAPEVYHVGVIVDATSVVPEIDETNNTRASSTVELKPDLVAVSVTGSATGRSVTLTDTVRNDGALPAPAPIRVDLRLSTDTRVGTGDPLLGQRTIGSALAPGASSTGTSTFTAAPSIPAGTYYGAMWADQADQIDEATEQNNKNTTPSQFFVGP
jgi:hypothetical protein